MLSYSLIKLKKPVLTVQTLETKTDTYANRTNPDKITHNELSHQNLHCL